MVEEEPPEIFKCLRCDWQGTFEEADFGQTCSDGCCYDSFCPKCGGDIADLDYNEDENKA